MGARWGGLILGAEPPCFEGLDRVRHFGIGSYPAQVASQGIWTCVLFWIPAFAGMTQEDAGRVLKFPSPANLSDGFSRRGRGEVLYSANVFPKIKKTEQ